MLAVNPYLYDSNVSMMNADYTYDLNLDGVQRTLSEIYRFAMGRIIYGMLFIFISGVFFAMSLADIFRRNYHE